MRAASSSEAVVSGVGPLPLSEREFSLFQALVEREAGIHLGPSKQALLVGRLSRRVRALGLTSFGAYFRFVSMRGNEEERVRMLDCLCTNETHFFREPGQFEFLRQRVFPEWTRRAAQGLMARRVRVWSAGCSTGEEPFSLAMVLRHHLPAEEGWEIDILATDLSTRILEQARQARWPVEKAAQIPKPYLRAYMLRGVGSQEAWMKADAQLRALVRFHRVNLNDGNGVVGRFDLLFCRNVLIYFDPTSRARAVERLLNHLHPQGMLFLGHSESLLGLGTRVRALMPTVYAQRAPPA